MTSSGITQWAELTFLRRGDRQMPWHRFLQGTTATPNIHTVPHLVSLLFFVVVFLFRFLFLFCLCGFFSCMSSYVRTYICSISKKKKKKNLVGNLRVQLPHVLHLWLHIIVLRLTWEQSSIVISTSDWFSASLHTAEGTGANSAVRNSKTSICSYALLKC